MILQIDNVSVLQGLAFNQLSLDTEVEAEACCSFHRYTLMSDPHIYINEVQNYDFVAVTLLK